MATIRVFRESDIPAATALLARVSPEHGWSTLAECESYFREILFDNPWRDLELPSWVAEQDGRMAGFYAVMPRPMLVRGRLIRVAVACQITVAPEYRHSLTALQLAQACLRGPQDLTVADAAHNGTRRMWLGIGGAAPALYGLDWIRPLRPARCVLSLLEQRGGVPRGLTLAARPLSGLVDLFAARSRWNRFYREASDVVDEDLDPATMLTHLAEVLDGTALRPVYDARSLAWLLHQAGRKTCHGRLRARGVRDGDGQMIGWYLYFVRPGGISEVVQIAARNGVYDRVLQRLLADAWRQGAAALRGRLDPRYVQALSAHQCWFRQGRCTLVHSRHADVMDAIWHGDAFLSRLDGEWWVRLVNFDG